MKIPKVAIITRTKDRPVFLRRAVNSVLSQSFNDWIHVIVNDGGGQPPIDSLAREFSDQYGDRLRVIHRAASSGMEAASNFGISSSDSEYLLIHDDDDTLDASFLTKCVAYLDAPPHESIRGVVTHAITIEERLVGEEIHAESTGLFRELGPCLLAWQIAHSNPVPPISFLYRRSAHALVGPYDESLPVLGDWDFLLRFISNFEIGVVQQPLARYHIRRNATGVTANSVTGSVATHKLYDGLIRNKILRSSLPPALTHLVQDSVRDHVDRDRLARLYSHPVIGAILRLWSRFINPGIPSKP